LIENRINIERNGRDTNPLSRHVQLLAQAHQFQWLREHISAPYIWPDVRRADEDNAVTKTSWRCQANPAYRPKLRRSKWFPNRRCSNAPHLSVKPTGIIRTVTYKLPYEGYERREGNSLLFSS